MKIAYLDCFSGISGDMFLGAMVDAGVPLSVLQEAVATLHLDVALELRRVDRSGIASVKIDVLTADGNIADHAHQHAPQPSSQDLHSDAHEHDHQHDHDHDHEHTHEHDHAHDHAHQHPHAHTHNNNSEHERSHSHDRPHVHGRSLSVIRDLIRGSALAQPVQATALEAFELLGHAEAKIHNVPVETIHFHEVGAVDAIADIVAASAGAHWLHVEQWFCSPLNVGGGHVHCAHGRFPVPAPATLELLRDLPVFSSGLQKELVTPTGAALLRALNVTSQNFPAMSMSATGYGAGTRDLPGQPNVLRLVLGESNAPLPAAHIPHSTNKIGIIETTIDDGTPELLSYIADRLLAAGASDVYRTPIQMKKGRVGTQLTVLCTPSRADALRQMVFAESTTLGLRYREEEKYSLRREIVTIDTQWGEIRVKLGLLDNGDIVNFAPEYEDCRAIAERHALPLKHIMQAASAAYQTQEERP